MDVNEGIALLSECYRLIKQSSNEGVQFATQQVDQFLKNSSSIFILVEFYEMSEDPVQRQFGLISLKHLIQNEWKKIDSGSRGKLFHTFLNFLIKENLWVNRRLLIDCIQIAMEDEYDDILFQFLKQAYMSGSEGYLEIALLLGTLIPHNDQLVANYSENVPFFTEMFIKGLNSNQPEVRLAGFYFLCYSKIFSNAHFFEQSPEHWMKCIELLDPYLNNQPELHRLVNLFNYAILERVYAGDFSSLISKLMTYFNPDSGVSVDILLQLHTIIQNICTVYNQVLAESDALIPVIQLHISLSFRLFYPDDSFPLSNAQFFESTFAALCTTQHSIEVLWEQCSGIASLNEGRFVFLRAVASTFASAPQFYLERIEDITELLTVSIMSNSQLLRDAAAQTADELIKFYVFESDELSIKLSPIVIKACHENVSENLLLVCSRLLDTTKKTDDYFDQTFPFLIDLIKNSLTDIQDAALKCLGSLARWSTIKINRDYPSLISLLNELLKSEADHLAHLKSPAVDFIAMLANSVGPPLDNFLLVVMQFLIANIGSSDDVSLSISCISAIKQITMTHPQIVFGFIEVIVPKLMTFAENDFSSQYMENLNNSPESQGDGDSILQEAIIKIPGYALQTLATLYEYFTENLESLLSFLMHCFEIHKHSYSQFCKSSIAIAISSVVKRINKDVNLFVKQFSLLLIPLLSTSLDMEVNFDVFCALSDTMAYHCYDSFEPEILKTIFEITSEFLTCDVAISYRPSERQRDVYEEILEFLKNFTISAYTESPKFLSGIIERFVAFLKEPVQRLRSYAIRFFGFLVASSSDSLGLELQQSTVNYAVQMAANDNDYAPFVTLQHIALNNPGLLEPYVDQLYQIFMHKLSMPFIKTEKLLMLRDNCVTAFAIFSSTIYRHSINFSECAPIVLSALPLALDFEGRKLHYVTQLFVKMYEMLKDQYPEKFLRVLVIIFANPRSVVEEMSFEEADYEDLLNILLQLITLPNANELCVSILENDPSKLSFLQDVIENG